MYKVFKLDRDKLGCFEQFSHLKRVIWPRSQASPISRGLSNGWKALKQYYYLYDVIFELPIIVMSSLNHFIGFLFFLLFIVKDAHPNKDKSCWACGLDCASREDLEQHIQSHGTNTREGRWVVIMSQLSTLEYSRVFHGFGQIKICKGGLVLGLSWFSLLRQLPQKNGARFKRGQNRLENNHLASLVYIGHTLCKNWIGSLNSFFVL